jgi:hypothetical protein
MEQCGHIQTVMPASSSWAHVVNTTKDPNKMRIAVLNRHEVDERHESVRRFETSFEDESVIQIPPPAWYWIFRRNRPAAVLLSSHQRSETGGDAKCGQQSQSIEPRWLTSAAVSQLPIIAYCSIRTDISISDRRTGERR